MTTCHGCNRPLEPLAAIRTYHSGCDPQGRVEMLERALGELVAAIDQQEDGLDPSVRLVQAMRDAKAWLEYRPAQMKGREG
jgi:hypothetical protein